MLSFLQFFMFVNVSSVPTNETCYNDEDYGSGNDSYSEYDNHTFSSGMMDCQCNEPDLMMVNINFLLEWLHNIKNLTISANQLKHNTTGLQVSGIMLNYPITT